MPRLRPVLALGVLLGLCGAGCSALGASHRVALRREGHPAPCSRSVAAPVLDTLGTMLFASATVGVLSMEPCSSSAALCIGPNSQKGVNRLAVVSGGIAALYAASAATGWVSVSTCRAPAPPRVACAGDDTLCRSLASLER